MKNSKTMKNIKPLAILLPAMFVACGTQGPLLGSDPKAACAAMNGASIDAATVNAGVPLASGAATVTSAEYVEASAVKIAPQGPTPAAMITPAAPSHCKLLGNIANVDAKAQRINFQVNLPTNWNGRSVQYGGGGFNGTLINGLTLVPAQRYDLPAPLSQGYATVGTDSGHQSPPGTSPMAFALNDEMLANFAHASYPKVRNVSAALMQRAYGRAPQKLYFVGSSEGGREGLTMAQRYPNAFDGIFSRVPVIHWTGLQFAGARNGIASMGDAWLKPAHVKLAHDATLAACDAADGTADRLVSNAAACLKTFDPARLRCAAGAQPRHLPERRADQRGEDAALTVHVPIPAGERADELSGWGIGGEDTPSFGPTGGWRSWWTGTAAPVVPAAPPPASGIAWFFGAGALQYFYARDPNVDPRTITPQSAAARVREVSALMDSTNPDLSAFHARGGKLIVLEHLADYAQSAVCRHSVRRVGAAAHGSGEGERVRAPVHRAGCRPRRLRRARVDRSAGCAQRVGREGRGTVGPDAGRAGPQDGRLRGDAHAAVVRMADMVEVQRQWRRERRREFRMRTK